MNDNICHFDESLFSEDDVDTVSLTIKNYKKKGGISDFLFRSLAPTNGTEQINMSAVDFEVNYKLGDHINIARDLEFEMKGPMGKGLLIEKEGIHIAFTGGTGSLLFLDLVAHLIRKNLKILNKDEDQYLSSHQFKLILYMAFQSRSESCGL